MMKKLMKFILSGFLALSLTACGSSLLSQTESGNSTDNKVTENTSNYPEKPITIIAPSGAGGGLDLTARALSKELNGTMLVEQTFTVENKPGGGQSVGLAEFVNKETKNPYALFLPSAPIIINHLKKEGNSPYSYQDMRPLAQLTKDYGAIVVEADSKYKDLKSLLDDLKANPQSLTLAGGSAPGSQDHLIAMLPAMRYGIDPKQIKYMAYDGGGEALTSLLGGNADVLSSDISSTGEYLKSGKVRVLAVSAPERLSADLFKDIPTYKEQGVDAEYVIWRGVFGPKDMPADAVKYWEEKLEALSQTEEWKKALEANGWENGFKKGDEFNTFLGEQEKLIQEILNSLGMLK